jgi:hypothetical protein
VRVARVHPGLSAQCAAMLAESDLDHCDSSASSMIAIHTLI